MPPFHPEPPTEDINDDVRIVAADQLTEAPLLRLLLALLVLLLLRKQEPRGRRSAGEAAATSHKRVRLPGTQVTAGCRGHRDVELQGARPFGSTCNQVQKPGSILGGTDCMVVSVLDVVVVVVAVAVL